SQFFTAVDVGLKQEWDGRVWLNPPYSRDLIGDFVSKLLTELDAGRIEGAIMLTNNCTDAKWFQKAGHRASVVCFPHSRIRFLDSDGNESTANPQGQALFYFGDDLEAFAERFAALGLLVFPLRRQRTTEETHDLITEALIGGIG